MKEKILILGASGSIGKALYENLTHEKRHDVIGTYYKNKNTNSLIQLDIRNYEKINILLKKTQPDIIIYAVGIKDVNICENDKNKCYQINTQPLLGIINASKKINKNTNLIFISSDYVFEGTKGNYKEHDFRKPKTVYGKSKLKSENIITKSKIRHTIIRTSSIISKNSSFTRWLTKKRNSSKKIELFQNIISTPTPIDILINTVSLIIDQSIDKKIIHAVGAKSMSRLELGEKLAKILTIQNKIKPVDADLSNSLFQHNLSLQQSRIVPNKYNTHYMKYFRKSLEITK